MSAPTTAQLARWAARRAQARKLRAQGLTLAEIGKRLRVSKQRVGQIIAAQQ